MIKNNLQDPNAVNAGTTAGKYLVVSEGPARELFLTEGLRFEKGVTYMMANTWDMSEEKVIEEDKSDLKVSSACTVNAGDKIFDKGRL